MPWRYKTVALPRGLTVIRKAFQKPPDPAIMVAEYMQQVIEGMAQAGWEYYRCDTVNMVEQPRMLGFIVRAEGNFFQLQRADVQAREPVN